MLGLSLLQVFHFSMIQDHLFYIKMPFSYFLSICICLVGMSQLQIHGFAHMHFASPFETFAYKTIRPKLISLAGNPCFKNLSYCCKKMFSKGIFFININMKKFPWTRCRRIFLDAIFLIRENFIESFCTKFSSSFYTRSLLINCKFPMFLQSVTIQNHDM